ncbi:restriction modification system DNA specificity domain protein [Melioribacter roseus P3M-2]|uniref:Restriction modification system DNA specificity domain protein n=1 Tax=Melioribacter roseus (strain DSM 23840 / JCM 17771 / VKM B-2668 / P3M-2) TaxID=1191523 RepID=I6ZZW5_MELRP|nr:restriction endonuclease subunit S [Melioribacter roseus]AFN74528.1 restriction modification system DNA specificity domain protein [Melioribacter roseus P3M-2]
MSDELNKPKFDKLNKAKDTEPVEVSERNALNLSNSDALNSSKRDWKECKLGDVIEFGNGKARPEKEGSFPVYGGNGVLGYANEFNYDGETIIIGRVGAYCGATYYENRPIWVSDNALAAKPRDKNITKFLYYFLKNLDLNQLAEGSSHPLVTQTLLNSIEIKITDNIPEQKSIAGVLSSLDDKIDLLHRQNKTLEAMAETLFRQWFLDKKTTVGKLGSLISETFGGEWGKENPMGDFNYPVYCLRGTDIADLQLGLAKRTPLRYIKEKNTKK